MSKTTAEIDRKSPNMLRTILEEVRQLRKEISFFIPTESIEEYAHPKRLKRSLERALKEYPIESGSSWK